MTARSHRLFFGQIGVLGLHFLCYDFPAETVIGSTASAGAP